MSEISAYVLFDIENRTSFVGAQFTFLGLNPWKQSPIDPIVFLAQVNFISDKMANQYLSPKERENCCESTYIHT